MNPFNYRNHPHYRRMVNAYLRQGHHSYLITKQQHSTTHYIWRTQGNSNVRESHANNIDYEFSDLYRDYPFLYKALAFLAGYSTEKPNEKPYEILDEWKGKLHARIFL